MLGDLVVFRYCRLKSVLLLERHNVNKARAHSNASFHEPPSATATNLDRLQPNSSIWLARVQEAHPTSNFARPLVAARVGREGCESASSCVYMSFNLWVL